MSKITVRTLNYVPTFEGKHNSVRCKTWLILLDRFLGKKGGLTLAELVKMGNFNYKSLTVLLSRWVKWRYLGYCSRPGGWEYHILKRGKDWLERWRDTMPLDRYIQEIETHQRGK